MIILHELCYLKTLDALQQGLGIRSRGADRQSPTLPIQICRQTEPEPHPIRDVRRRCCRCRPSSARQQLNYCKYAGALGRRRPGAFVSCQPRANMWRRSAVSTDKQNMSGKHSFCSIPGTRCWNLWRRQKKKTGIWILYGSLQARNKTYDWQ